MRKLLFVTCLSVFSVPAMASCDAVKEHIVATLEAKGVKSYTLEVQPVQAAAKDAPAASAVSAAPAGGSAAQKSSGKVVGTCDGGTKQIIYTRK